MNTILTNIINDSINREQPFLGPSLQFKEDSDLETFKNIILALIGPSYSTSQVYILWGCVRTGAADGASSGSAAVTAGAVFFNGEVYTVAAFSTANINSQYLASALSVTNGTPDPVTFADQTSQYVHNVRQWLITQAGSAGSTPVSSWVSFSSGTEGVLATQNNYGNVSGTPILSKDAFGNVRMEGTLSSPGSITSQTFCTLPAGYAPKRNKLFVAVDVTNNLVTLILVTSGGGCNITTLASASVAASSNFTMALSWNVNH